MFVTVPVITTPVALSPPMFTAPELVMEPRDAIVPVPGLIVIVPVPAPIGTLLPVIAPLELDMLILPVVELIAFPEASVTPTLPATEIFPLVLLIVPSVTAGDAADCALIVSPLALLLKAPPVVFTVPPVSRERL